MGTRDNLRVAFNELKSDITSCLNSLSKFLFDSVDHWLISFALKEMSITTHQIIYRLPCTNLM